MEITAVIEALKHLKRPCEVEVYSDSAYVVNAFNNGWINREELIESAKAYGKAPYGQYLQKVAEGKIMKEY